MREKHLLKQRHVIDTVKILKDFVLINKFTKKEAERLVKL